MRYGITEPGPDTLTLDADRLYVFDVGDPAATDLVVGSVVLYLDGAGGGAGEQRLRAAAMAADDPTSLVLGDEVVIEQGQDAGWVHLTFDVPPRFEAGRELRIGVAVGAAGGLARLSGALAHDGVSERYTTTYGEDPDLGGGATDVHLLASICAVAVEPWIAPDVPDDDLATLPLRVAQGVLGATGPTGAALDAVSGWHYDPDDPPPPSSAIARTDGPLAPLVGERVRVTADSDNGPLSVVVVLIDEQPFDDELLDQDMTLARPAFERIAPLWTETLPVRLEVLA